MPHLILHPPRLGAEHFQSRFASVREELQLPSQFPAEVLTEAENSMLDSGLPHPPDRVDAQHLPLVAIDPPGATDLDQAFAAERRPGGGFRVYYAIADVAAFVTPGGLVDAEARARGVTLYSPDLRTPLHPPVLSEDRASLLPGAPRPALLWQIDLDADGMPVGADLRRSMIRVREAITYREAQHRIDAGIADESLALLAPIGRLRQEREAQRGGVSINLPAQEIIEHDAAYSLAFDRSLDIESWNAHISLLTGIVAGRAMVDAEIGIVRTLPQPAAQDLRELRATARALDLNWDDTTPYPDFVRSLTPNSHTHNAFLVQSTRVLRGAGYAAFNGAAPAYHHHGAIASTYAHVTAPLRRLVDRFANEILLCLYAGLDPRVEAAWAVDALEELPSLMGSARQRSSSLERSMLDLTEALVLQSRIGEHFQGVVVDVNPERNRARIQIKNPAIVANIAAHTGDSTRHLAEQVKLELTSVDTQTRTVNFNVIY